MKTKSTTSSAIAVKVQPRLQLSKIGAHRYSLRAAGGQSFAGKFGTLQRYNGVLRRWVNVKRVVLRANGTGAFPTVISSSSFRATLAARRKIRVVLPQLQVGRCYLPGRSNITPELARSGGCGRLLAAAPTRSSSARSRRIASLCRALLG